MTIKRSSLQSVSVFLVLAVALACASTTVEPDAPLVRSADPLACTQLGDAEHPLAAAGASFQMRPLRFVDLPGVPEDEEPDIKRVVGVRMRFAAQPGMTRESLTRQIRCFRRGSKTGAQDPLLVADAQIEVSAHGGLFTVDVSSEDRTVAGRILESARHFAAQSAPTPVATTAR
jgi:hypothetical protein